MTGNYVLDASAVLALLNGELGKERVESALPGSIVSAVNMSEVAAKLMERGMPEEDVRAALGYLNCEVVDFTAASAWVAARLRLLTRDKGLSLGDRACLALANARKLPVMTTDQAWKLIKLDLQIEVIR